MTKLSSRHGRGNRPPPAGGDRGAYPGDGLRSSAQASRSVAQEIAALIQLKAARGESTVLGLATGSTPTSVYDELIRLHREEGLSFRNVITFNLDEYWPMGPDELQSYHRFMREHLFDHIDIHAAERPRPRRHGSAGEGRRSSARSTSGRSRRPAGWITRSWASAGPGTSGSTSPAARATAARA